MHIAGLRALLRGGARRGVAAALLALLAPLVPGAALGQGGTQGAPMEGAWRGEYVCGTLSAPATLLVPPRAGRQGGVFQFGRSADGRGEPGIYEVAVEPAADRLGVAIRPLRWVVQPPDYEMVGFTGRLDPAGVAFRGRVGHPACDRIVLHRDASPDAAARLAALARDRGRYLAEAASALRPADRGAAEARGTLDAASARSLVEGHTLRLWEAWDRPGGFSTRTWYFQGTFIVMAGTAGRSALSMPNASLQPFAYTWRGDAFCLLMARGPNCLRIVPLGDGRLALRGPGGRDAYVGEVLGRGDAFDVYEALQRRQREWDALSPAERARREAPWRMIEEALEAAAVDFIDSMTPRTPTEEERQRRVTENLIDAQCRRNPRLC